MSAKGRGRLRLVFVQLRALTREDRGGEEGREEHVMGKGFMRVGVEDIQERRLSGVRDRRDEKSNG